MFIVLYGINNLGKSTQAHLLVERLNKEGHDAEYIKYPRYEITPTGHIINAYLREGNPLHLSKREFQLFNALNRTQYEPELKQKLDAGVIMVGEDYTGSGLAWGIGTGVDEQFMKTINDHLLKENLAFVFDGNRFTEATESDHTHENDVELQEHVRSVYTQLGQEFGWLLVNANRTREAIHEQIWDSVRQKLDSLVD